MKKTLSIFLSITTILWMLPLTALVVNGQTTLVDGDLIRGPDGIKVYIIKPFVHGSYVGFKRHIFNPAVFNMYQHFDWGNIKGVDQATLDSYQTSDLYRMAGDTKVYGMNEIDEAAGLAEKRWVNMTAEEFLTDGYKWEQIFTINGTEGAFYSTGTDIVVGGGTTTTTGGTGAVNVALASDSPASKVVASGSSFNHIMKVALTAGSQAASVTGVTITKYGLLSNTNVSGVSVWDGAGVRHGNILTSLTSDNKVNISFSGNPINVPAGGTAYLNVKVNFASGSYSGTAYFGIASASDIESAGSVGGTFPVVGNVMSLTDGSSSLGAYTISALALGGAAASSTTSGNTDIGETKEVAKFQFTSSNSNEDLLVDNLIVYVDGSIVEATDVKDWKLVDQGGVELATAEKPADRKVTFNFATPYTIGKGTSKTFTVKATVMDGATRYFRVGILENVDMMVRGSSTGFYIITSTSIAGLYGATPWFNIKSGALTITKSTASPSGELSPGSTNVELARFEVRSSGEALEIRKLDLYIATLNSPVTGKYLAGVLKLQSADGNATYYSASADTAGLYATSLPTPGTAGLTLSSYITLGSNETKVLKVIADMNTSATAGSYQIGIGDFYAKRLSTNDFTTFVGTTGVTGNAMTVSAATLTVAQNASFASKNLAPGSNGVVIGSFAIQASSAEDIRISNINLSWDSTNTNHASPDVDLTNLSLWDGSTQFGSTQGTPAAYDSSNSFSGALTVSKSTTKILDVKANIGTTPATGEKFVAKLAASSISAVGVNSGNIAAVTGLALNGQTITMAAGSLTVTRDSASAGSKILTAGLSAVELEQLNFAAVNESLTLSKITLNVSGNAANFGTVYLKDGATTLGSTTLFSGDATFTGLNVAIPADGTKKLGVFADINASGVMVAASTASVNVKADTPITYMTVNKASGGQLTANDVNGSGANTNFAASNVFLFHNSAPVIAAASDTPSGTKTGAVAQEVAKFTVYNQGTRDMRLASMQVTVTPSSLGTNGGVSTSSVELWDGTTRLAAATHNLITTTAVVTFDTLNDISDVLGNYVISTGTTKTFTIKATTTTMRTSLNSGQTSNLVVSIAGSIGYSANDASNEVDWTGGGFFYYYTPIGGSENATTYTASDNYPVNGGTLTY